jgi:DNA-binding CsgD family transcriptional regulator
MTDAGHGHVGDEFEANPRIRLVLSVVFLIIVVGGSIDVVLDKPTTLFDAHILVEVTLIAVSLGAVVYLARGWYGAQSFARELATTAEVRTAERDQWRDRARHLLDGLSGVMDGQFEEWELTPTERETALMLLQGHSHKRIASLSGRSERTVRQHAVAVYRKSGLAGRAELAGFFLGGLGVTPDTPEE